MKSVAGMFTSHDATELLPVRSEEHVYRCGFEAAQWCDDRENVRPLHGNMIDEPAFRRGWERGHEYRRGRSLRKSA